MGNPYRDKSRRDTSAFGSSPQIANRTAPGREQRRQKNVLAGRAKAAWAYRLLDFISIRKLATARVSDMTTRAPCRKFNCPPLRMTNDNHSTNDADQRIVWNRSHLGLCAGGFFPGSVKPALSVMRSHMLREPGSVIRQVLQWHRRSRKPQESREARSGNPQWNPLRDSFAQMLIPSR